MATEERVYMLVRGRSGCRFVTRRAWRARASPCPPPLPSWTLCWRDSSSTAAPPTEEAQEEAPPPPPEPTFGEKLRGVEGFAPPPRPPLRQVLLTGATSFAGIGALSVLHYGVTAGSEFTLLLGSFGATAVLVFGAPAVPFSQPRNVVGGHLLAAAAGVAAQQLLTLPMGTPALAAPVAVSAAITLMASTGTIHPPAGGTALIAATATHGPIATMGPLLLVPTGLGACGLVASAALLNNALGDAGRRYPQSWA